MDKSGLVNVTFLASLVVPLVFLFNRPIGSLFDALGLGPKFIPAVLDISDRYDFLLNCRSVKNIFDNLTCKSQIANNLNIHDFQLFGLLTWFFLALGLLRILIDAFRLDKLDGVAEEIREGKLADVLIGYAVLGPFVMYVVTDFETASYFGPASRLMFYSPRAYLAFTIGLFGVTTAFAVEGILVLLWLIFRRKPAA